MPPIDDGPVADLEQQKPPDPRNIAPSSAPESCFLHTLPDEHSSSGMFGGNAAAPMTRHARQEHPYLFGTVAAPLCSACFLRVQLTREAIRTICAGCTLQREWGFNCGWSYPLLALTHGLDYGAKALRVVRSGEATVHSSDALLGEDICAVCAQVTSAGEVATCCGQLDGDVCRLSYHHECLRRIGKTLAPGVRELRECPFCSGCSRLSAPDRDRMRNGYPTLQRQMAVKTAAKAAASTVLGTPKAPEGVIAVHEWMEHHQTSNRVMAANQLWESKRKPDAPAPRKTKSVMWPQGGADVSQEWYVETEYGLPANAGERERRAFFLGHERSKMRRQAEEAERRRNIAKGQGARSEGAGHLCGPGEAVANAQRIAEEAQ